jgi:hypothetical protein
LPIVLKTRNSSHVITAPTSTSDKAPIGAVYSASGKIASIKLSPVDRSTVTGLFAYRLKLDQGSYTSGQYLVAITYTVGSGAYTGSVEFTFQIVDGGNANGSVTSMCEFLRPEAEHIVFGLDVGNVYDGRNPT